MNHSKTSLIQQLQGATRYLGKIPPHDDEAGGLYERLMTQAKATAVAAGAELPPMPEAPRMETILATLAATLSTVDPIKSQKRPPVGVNPTQTDLIGSLTTPILEASRQKAKLRDDPRTQPTPVAAKALPASAAASLTPPPKVNDSDGLKEYREWQGLSEAQRQSRRMSMPIKEWSAWNRKVKHQEWVAGEVQHQAEIAQQRLDNAAREQASREHRAESSARMVANLAERERLAKEIAAGPRDSLGKLLDTAPTLRERAEILAAHMLSLGRSPADVATVCRFKSIASMVEEMGFKTESEMVTSLGPKE